MADDRWLYDEIQVDTGGFFTTEHIFHTPSGTLASLKASSGMAQGTYQAAGGQNVTIRRTGCLSRGYELFDGGSVRGAAAPRGFFKQGYFLRFDGQEFHLVPEGAFRQSWLLLDAAGRTLLWLGPRGILRRGARLVPEQPVEVPLAVFAYYLYAVIQQEMAAVIAAT